MHWGADFAGKHLKLTLWQLYSHSQALEGLRPSAQLGVAYRWVAQDLDLAAAALGHHVKDEFEKRRRQEEKKQNPPSKGTKGKGKSHSPYRPLGEERIGEIWIETVADITLDKIVFHINSPDKPAPGQSPARWRIEKPKTGDEKIDSGAHKGARTTFDEHGRRRAAWDASGRQVYSWKRGKV